MNDQSSRNNASGRISSLEWSAFPLEVDRFMTILCLENKVQTFDNSTNLGQNRQTELSKCFENLKNFFYIINPQKIVKYSVGDPNKNLRYEGRETLLINITEKYNWQEDIVFMKLLSGKKYHILVVGEYKNIPKILLSSSDLIVFENRIATLEYFRDHRLLLNHFDDMNFFPVADKTGSEFTVRVICKDFIKSYRKVPLLFD